MTAAIGRRAACRAPGALAMPAPQVFPSKVQRQKDCTSFASAGTWHAVVEVVEVWGNATEPSFSRVMSWHELRLAFTEAISAPIPDTSGAEKLVPRLGLLTWSEYVLIASVVLPELKVVVIGYTHGFDPVSGGLFTQFPAGALSATSGPRLLNPDFEPSWRSPATAATPGQFPGASTGPLSFPAEATMSTPFAVTWLITSAYVAGHDPVPPRLMFMTLAGFGFVIMVPFGATGMPAA